MHATRRRREKGTALAAAAIFLVAMLVLAAAAVAVARFSDTPTEVQIAADVGAMGAAVARARGKTEAGAIDTGTDLGALNFANGKPIDPAALTIVAGHYDPTAAAGAKFDPARTPHNAFRSTVIVGGNRLLMASILNGQTGTDVQRQAVAVMDCPRDAVATLPIAVCTASLTEIQPGETCTDQAKMGRTIPDSGETGCWADLGVGSAGGDKGRRLLPEACGGAGGQELSQGDSIDLQTGDFTRLLQVMQCCIACKDQHKFTVPVIDCVGASSCKRSARTQGFATINVAQYRDVTLAGTGRNHCRQYFPDCTNPGPEGDIDNPEHKRCSAGCSNVGADCQADRDCSGCGHGCNSPQGLYINQTCSTDAGGSGGGRCFGNSTAMLGR